MFAILARPQYGKCLEKSSLDAGRNSTDMFRKFKIILKDQKNFRVLIFSALSKVLSCFFRCVVNRKPPKFSRDPSSKICSFALKSQFISIYVLFSHCKVSLKDYGTTPPKSSKGISILMWKNQDSPPVFQRCPIVFGQVQ